MLAFFPASRLVHRVGRSGNKLLLRWIGGRQVGGNEPVALVVKRAASIDSGRMRQ
jgi:hypothetical protein